MITVNYAQSYPYALNPVWSAPQVVKRAFLEIEVHYLANHHRFLALVDTGADDLILDSGVGAILGVPDQPQDYPINTASGTAWLHREPGLTVYLAGTSVQTDVLFGVLPMPLLGRRPLLTAVDYGFGKQEWHHT
jgi:hypothetical protein